jgi:hypothetical protein
MIAAGFTIVAVNTPFRSGDPPGYEMTRPNDGKTPEEVMALHEKCALLRPTYRPLTDDEIRGIYDESVKEYHCLIGLGYQPDAPPSFETFLQTWKTGPWYPEQSHLTDHWTQAQYDEAKTTCTLQNFDMDFTPEQ